MQTVLILKKYLQHRRSTDWLALSAQCGYVVPIQLSFNYSKLQFSYGLISVRWFKNITLRIIYMKSWESGKYCFYGIHSQYTHRLSRTMGKCGFFSQTRKKTLLYPRLTSFGNNNNISIDLRKQKIQVFKITTRQSWKHINSEIPMTTCKTPLKSTIHAKNSWTANSSQSTLSY